MDEYIDIGRISRPRGLRGDVWIESLSDDPARLLEGVRLYLRRKDGLHPLTVVDGLQSGNRVSLRFAEIATRTQAEEARGSWLAMHRDDLPPLAENENFIADLIGLEVRLEDGRVVGRVADVLEMPSSHVYVIQQGEFEALVPSLEQFVPEVHVEDGYLVIRPLEGMLPAGMVPDDH